MSLIVRGIRLPLDADESEAIAAALEKCGCKDSISAAIYKQSFDLRHQSVTQVLSVMLTLLPEDERKVIQKSIPDVTRKAPLIFPEPRGDRSMGCAPVVVGFGPAGMFAALTLAKNGYRPIVFEKGPKIAERDEKVQRLNDTGILDENANIQFGEGGAGTYSDGKLTTRINDPKCEMVLFELCRHGAPDEIQKNARPHIGSDRLRGVVESIRHEILSLGGQIYFDTEIDFFEIQAGRLRAVRARGERVMCRFAVLAGGHSARKTFGILNELSVPLESKPFSVGLRVEHLQSDIDAAMYGRFAGHKKLPPAEYTLSHKSKDGRGIYSFCMCPGGVVVAAASEQGFTVTNGMSFHSRAGKNANAAIAVGVSPGDYGNGPLAGIEFQRRIERAAYEYTGSFKAPAQRLGDFLKGRESGGFSKVLPSYTAGTVAARLGGLFPPYVTQSLCEAFTVFGRKIKGFDDEDAVLTAPETRTSSPVRIIRHKDSLESPGAAGLIPCGEGAGYAGGIISAAVDGIRAAERIMAEYTPFG